MKPVTIKKIKDELHYKSFQELIELCLLLSKFKKENKELLTYLLFEAADEEEYIKEIKVEVDEAFLEINTSRGYFIKKGIRKILKRLKTYIRYSGKKETEAELLIYFCKKMKTFSPSVFKNRVLANTYERQLTMALNAIDKLYGDLQYDYRILIEELD